MNRKSLADVLYYRTCKRTSTFTEGKKSITFTAGSRYITTRAAVGVVTVLGSYWAYNIPTSIFGRPTKMISQPKENKA